MFRLQLDVGRTDNRHTVNVFKNGHKTGAGYESIPLFYAFYKNV
jgi:hypothetical protein